MAFLKNVSQGAIGKGSGGVDLGSMEKLKTTTRMGTLEIWHCGSNNRSDADRHSVLFLREDAVHKMEGPFFLLHVHK